MTGPLDRFFANSPFDLDHDGKIDAAEWAYINDTIFKEEDRSSSDYDDEDDEFGSSDYDDDEFDSDDYDDGDAGFDSDGFGDDF